jgi:hypothetical protein
MAVKDTTQLCIAPTCFDGGFWLPQTGPGQCHQINAVEAGQPQIESFNHLQTTVTETHNHM